MTTHSTAPSPEAGPAPDWRRIGSFVTGQAAVQCGSFALIIAMNWTAVQLGGRSAVTCVILASTLPRALMLLFGGALADTLGPRAVVLRATATRLAVLAVGALITAGADSLWPLVAVAVVEGSLLGLTGPASGVLLTRLAPQEHLGRANSLFAMVMRLAPIAGSPLGAWLVVAGGLSGAMLVSAAGCAVWLVCAFHVTRGMGRPERGDGPGPSLFRRSGDGLLLLGGHPRLRWMFIACFCMDFAFLWPAEVALPLRASGEGWGIGAVAAALSAFSVGALVSAAAGAALAHRIPVPVKLVVTGTGLAVGLGAMALMPSPPVLAVTAGAVGLCSGMNGPALVTAYQQAVPEGKLGAAMSTFSLSSIGAAPLSLAVFSSLSAPLGVTGTWLLCAGVALFSPVAATLALRAPITRKAPAATGASAAPEPTATAV
ncbi:MULTISPECIES: MFS transporter [unclassified Streptomyces]|uniref:MFS transporter n=1 Tax=unclassified Streptomyces TaxID=2593676 RepID=UPI000DAD9FEA|nr:MULTISPECIES: MFS transporter [unclassified Streptomyces]PZT77554.1 MFS transporter [Streptomyces sp. AC1-42W]PZT78492.1 MFS transporter [Streptomyces sp. AC1-42T]WUC96788.1 MFS transporter [Streptomyces sp. NBC_00525]